MRFYMENGEFIFGHIEYGYLWFIQDQTYIECWGLGSDVSERGRSEIYQVLVEAMKVDEINQKNI